MIFILFQLQVLAQTCHHEVTHEENTNDDIIHITIRMQHYKKIMIPDTFPSPYIWHSVAKYISALDYFNFYHHSLRCSYYTTGIHNF
jgi:hypothetical protein